MNRSRITSLTSLIALGVLPIVAAGCTADASGENSADTASAVAVAAPIGIAPPVSNQPVLPPPVMKTTASGQGWQRVTISGTALDGATSAPVAVDGDYWVISGRQSIANVNLPAKTAAALTASMATTPLVAGDNELIFFPKSASDSIEAGANPVLSGNSGIKADYSCSDTSGLLSHTYSFSDPYSTTHSSDSNGFTGTANLSASVSGSIEGAVSYTIKKVWCIPYPVIHSMSVSGEAGVTAGASINGSFSKPWSYSDQIAAPVLGTITLPIIPIPITFSLPIKVGVDASANAQVTSSASVYANASFAVGCNSNGCSASKSGSAGFTPNAPPTFSASGMVKLTPWGEVDLQAFIVSASILSAQVGVRAGMPSDLFTYSGNTCGDADHDGTNEFVSGATIDTSVDLSLQASGEVLGDNIGPYSWDIWHTHAGFWTIYNDGLLNPIFYSAPHNGTGTVTMEGQMRPCWPYSDAVSYQINWSDGTTQSLSDPPQTLWSEAHNVGYGSHTESVTAVSDAAGRTLQATTSRGQWVSPIVVNPLPGGGVNAPPSENN